MQKFKHNTILRARQIAKASYRDLSPRRADNALLGFFSRKRCEWEKQFMQPLFDRRNYVRATYKICHRKAHQPLATAHQQSNTWYRRTIWSAVDAWVGRPKLPLHSLILRSRYEICIKIYDTSISIGPAQVICVALERVSPIYWR